MAELHIETKVVHVDSAAPACAVIEQAAELLRAGRLVAFPTETVYGLGANALDSRAVERIFEAKGRPANNPIIVHVASIKAAREIAADWTEAAGRLAEAFWPGPLTVVLMKAACVPDIVTAAQTTVAIRMPAHPVAKALLEETGLPIAAPSANRSTGISPTLASHVLRSMRGRIDMVLDAGPTQVGIESTVVDVRGGRTVILRPGSISREQIERVLGGSVEEFSGQVSAHAAAISPGMMARHYAPLARVECAESDVVERARRLCDAGSRVGVLTITQTPRRAEGTVVEDLGIIILAMPSDSGAYAARLYAALHELDDAGMDRILIERPPQSPDWQAIHDRLRRMMQ